MIQLNEKYNREDFLDFLIKDFVPDFDKDIRPVNCKGLTIINEATYLGQSKSLDLYVFELSYSETHANKRVALATDGFRIMQSTATFNALIVFNPQNKNNWRLSFMTATPEKNEKGGVSVHLSNPRRYSFELGENTKINTPYSFLIKKGKLFDLDDLRKRFSIEVVNKEFYMQIAELFTELVGGTRGKGRNQRKYPGIIALPSVPKESRENHEFAVRLIGRLIFCWFLREKKSNSDLPLISREILSLEAANDNPDYYHSILEPLFFEVLNKPLKLRVEEYRNSLFGKTPYLNGGLFTPQTWDYYDLKLRFILNIPDEWLRKLFEVLELYNFTVDENTSVDIDLSIDPEMLGRIFENLLAEINPETGETARKSTGSYYTPRTIVDYMVDESLIQYLKDKTSIDESKIRAIVSYDLSDDEDYPLNKDEKDKLIEALSKITILDPACGSGAFPIGALQKIVFILQRIDQDAKLWFKQQIEGSAPEIKRIIEREFAERNFDYIRKLGIIRQSIFGVDIQPIATEIARLRCFLTLVVDERVVDEEENRGIEPLPNLDFKFVTANSLIGLPSSQANSQVGLFEDQEGINKLKEVRDMYFNASGTERENLKLQFVQVQNKMFQKMIQEHTLAELTQKLSSWNPFGHEASDWFDSDWMFGINNGFDIVIGNPPYYNIRKLEKTQLKYIKKDYEEIHTGYNDIMYYFVFRGVQILKANGILGMITSNYYLGNSYSKLFRKFLARSIVKIINFKEYQIFKEASVHTNIIFCSKNSNVPSVLFFEFYDENKELNGDIESQCSYFRILRNELGTVWLIANNNSAELINKLYVNSTELGDITDILKGTTSGSRTVYTVTKEFAKQNNFETPLLKNSINSMDIQRYFLNDSGKVLIYIDDEVDIDNYPNIKKYLLKFKDELSKRNEVKSGNYPWFRLERPREKYVFEARNKLVVPYRSEFNKFALDKQQGFNDGGGSYAIALKEGVNLDILFILGILNSTLMNWYYGFIGKPKGKIREYFHEPLSKIPIHIVDFSNPSSKETYDKLISLVKQLLDLQLIIHLSKPENYKTSSKQNFVMIDQQINELVYKLYGLTPEEIAIVEGGERNG